MDQLQPGLLPGTDATGTTDGAQALHVAVGARLRALREERGMSLSALAAAAGVGKGSLSEIEHAGRNPTLGTLYALAGALGTPLSALLAERPGAEVASDGVSARLLDTHRLDDGTTVEVFRLRLAPGARRRSPAHGAGVVEHLLVTAGRVRAGRYRQEVEIGAGESARWESAGPHSYAALGDDPVDAVLVIRTPAGLPGHRRAVVPPTTD